ncbi:molybdenum cofactor guanylyltransferase [Sporomusa aerivorans]|uniref:molybdenum cofactor guanylyltransferase n=1 Tax=Sporomusa aerivorans TaxID=204936 RepID=UPI00352B5179
MNNLQESPGRRNTITPFILSGGKSRRMGTNKSFVRLGDKPLIEIVVEKTAVAFAARPVIITNHPGDYAYLGCDMIGDIVKDKGPLGGIHSGLIHSPTPYIFVFACDMPFIEKNFIYYMMNRLTQEDILIPHNGESVEPLHAIYSRNCLPAIEEHLHEDHRCVQSFFKDVNVAYVSQSEMTELKLSDFYFLNLNTLEDLAKAESYFKRSN